MPWKRPESVRVGQVWLRFQGKAKDGKPAPNFQIRDMEPQYREECIEMMMETFIRDEPLCKALDIKSDPASLQQIRSDWEEFIAQGISIACFSEHSGRPDQLVGFNILVVKNKGDEEDLYGTKGQSWKKLLKTLQEAENLVDIFSHYGVDSYLSSSGVCVKEEWRGHNLGARMFEARKPICRALGLTASATVFTAKTSQVLAAKAGYELLATLDYSSMNKYGIDLSKCETPSAHLRGIKFDFSKEL